MGFCRYIARVNHSTTWFFLCSLSSLMEKTIIRQQSVSEETKVMFRNTIILYGYVSKNKSLIKLCRKLIPDILHYLSISPAIIIFYFELQYSYTCQMII